MKQIISLLLFLLLLSCESNKVYEQSIEVEEGVWKRSQLARFTFEIQDTTEHYNLFVNLRNSGKYPYSNLYLFITMKSPEGKYARDTLNCKLADRSGKWLGRGSGDVWSHKIPFKRGVIFRRKGKFTITMEQAMRKQDLPGILDVGLTVEKMKNIPQKNALKKQAH